MPPGAACSGQDEGATLEKAVESRSRSLGMTPAAGMAGRYADSVRKELG